MWLTYFLAFAYIITLVRIVIFALSSGSLEEKLGRAKNWIIGLVLLTLSWFVLARLFGLNENMKIGTSNSNDTEINNEAFGTGKGGETNQNGVPIKLD